MSTTGKVSQHAVIARLKLPDQPPAVSEAGAAAEVKTEGPQSRYGTRSPHHDQKTHDGSPVAGTASVAELYGGKWFSDRPPLQAIRYASREPPMTRAQAEAEVKKLTDKLGHLEERLAGRVGELDAKWSHLRLARRLEALGVYLQKSPNLDEATKAELGKKISDAQAALDKGQEKIDATQVKVGQLKMAPKEKIAEIRQRLVAAIKAGKPEAEIAALRTELSDARGGAEARNALAAELRAARQERTQAVDAATATVDDAGLKVDRLVVTEELIDPGKGEGSQYGSLQALYGEYFETKFLLHTLDQLYLHPYTEMARQMQKSNEESRRQSEIRADEVRAEWLRQKDSQERGSLMRDTLEHLGQKTVVEAEKSGDTMKISAARATAKHVARTGD